MRYHVGHRIHCLVRVVEETVVTTAHSYFERVVIAHIMIPFVPLARVRMPVLCKLAQGVVGCNLPWSGQNPLDPRAPGSGGDEVGAGRRGTER